MTRRIVTDSIQHLKFLNLIVVIFGINLPMARAAVYSCLYDMASMGDQIDEPLSGTESKSHICPLFTATSLLGGQLALITNSSSDEEAELKLQEVYGCRNMRGEIVDAFSSETTLHGEFQEGSRIVKANHRYTLRMRIERMFDGWGQDRFFKIKIDKHSRTGRLSAYSKWANWGPDWSRKIKLADCH